jgi:hypothetical protein
MNDQDRTRPVEVTIAGVVAFLLGTISAVSIAWELLSPSKPAPVVPPSLVPLSAPSSGALPFGLVDSLLLIVCGFGLFRLRPLARHVIMILIVGSFLAHGNRAILFGTSSLDTGVLLLHILFGVFMLWLLGRKKVRTFFVPPTGRFRLLTCYGFAISAVVLLVVLPTTTLLGIRSYFALAFDEPLTIPEPMAISLPDASPLTTSPTHREISLFGISGLIPRDFALASVGRPRGPTDHWSATLVSKKQGRTSLISINSKSMFSLMPDLQEPMRIKDPYDFELAFRTNSLSPVIALLRIIARPAGIDEGLVSFRSESVRGFFRSTQIQKGGGLAFHVTFYALDGSRSGAIDIICSRDDYSRDDVLRMIASMRFVRSAEEDSERMHQDGLTRLGQGDSHGAGFNLANAYFVSPGSARYGVELAKYLANRGSPGRWSAQDILEGILQVSPEHREAKELLELLRAGDRSIS